MFVYVCVRACVRACLRVCVCVSQKFISVKTVYIGYVLCLFVFKAFHFTAWDKVSIRDQGGLTKGF